MMAKFMAGRLNPVSWLTLRRIRVHGLLLAVCLWSVYAVDMGHSGLLDRNGLIKGTDFIQFYTLGSFALQGRSDLLYNMQAQSAWMHHVIPNAKAIAYPPLYGPQVALFFEPFARLSYGSALVAWLAFNFLIYGACCYCIWRFCPNLKKYASTIIILALAFPGLFHLITFGQSSGVPLLCFTVAFLFLRAEHFWLAGLALGTIIFKPQIGIAAVVVFIFAKEWRVIVGAMAAAVAQLAIGWGHFGTRAMRDYFHSLLHANDFPALLDPHLYQTFSLRGFWLLLVPFPYVALALYILSAIAVLALTVLLWRSAAPLGARYAGLLLASVLVAPHCNVYDLVVLAPAFVLLADFILADEIHANRARIISLIYSCFLLFLLEPLTRLIHLQLGVLAIVALLWVIYSPAKKSSAALISAHYS